MSSLQAGAVNVVRTAAPVREEVVRLIRMDILEQRLRPGDRLVESALCTRYGVSRTVIREALRQLESERLITMRPHRGPIVTVLTAHEIRSIYEVRAALEGLAGELFAARASEAQAAALLDHVALMEDRMLAADLAERNRLKDRFYAILLAGVGNDVLEADLAGVHARIVQFRHYAFTDDERVRSSLLQVRRIADAAADRRDPGAARAACESHIHQAGQLAVAEYQRRLS
ncbi:GntR family transcriptional regulator [Amycolatopsis taiwanensis]|uniref:GntR family transcriptional regulator n=1 Tax=Amycolatopsis taiwanensis TaxID=342230 RepID=UPI00048349F7|nr:GntR family transcriptional regulator [Amycolatopsis taiwanensis]